MSPSDVTSLSILRYINLEISPLLIQTKSIAKEKQLCVVSKAIP